MFKINTEGIEENQSDELILTATKKLFAHSQEKIFIKDHNLIYRAVTPKFVAMAGWESEEDLIGKTDFEVFEDQELAQRYHDDDLEMMKH